MMDKGDPRGPIFIRDDPGRLHIEADTKRIADALEALFVQYERVRFGPVAGGTVIGAMDDYLRAYVKRVIKYKEPTP